MNVPVGSCRETTMIAADCSAANVAANSLLGSVKRQPSIPLSQDLPLVDSKGLLPHRLRAKPWSLGHQVGPLNRQSFFPHIIPLLTGIFNFASGASPRDPVASDHAHLVRNFPGWRHRQSRAFSASGRALFPLRINSRPSFAI